MKGIRHLTEAKELRMSQPYVMSKDEFIARGCKYMGSIGMAAKSQYFTARICDKIGRPVSDDEWKNITHFAMFSSCYQTNCIALADGTRLRPCLPVFYRAN